MNRKVYTSMNKLFEAIGHPPFILWLSIFLFGTFFIWSFSGFDSLFYEIFHILLAIVTLIIALVIEGSEKADTKAIQYKLDEIIKAMPQIANEKAGLELELKTGKSLDEVIRKVNRITKKRNS